MSMHGLFHWNELLTGDVEKCKAFFGQVCGWSFEDMPMPDGTYTIAKAGENMVGGIMDKTKTSMPDMPNHWAAYIAVDDVDAAVAKAAGAGGTVLQPCCDVEGVGRIAIVADPSGASIGIMTPAQMG